MVDGQSRISLRSSLSAQLAAAKPCEYRGESQLPVLPWRADFPGLWVLVDCAAGLGSSLAAATILGIRFVALVAGTSPDFRAAIKPNFPAAVFASTITELNASTFDALLERRKITGFIFHGGHYTSHASPYIHILDQMLKLITAVQERFWLPVVAFSKRRLNHRRWNSIWLARLDHRSLSMRASSDG